MGVVLQRHHHHFIQTLIVFALLFLLSSSSSSSSAAASLNILSGELGERTKETGESGLMVRILDQNQLGGSGLPGQIVEKKGLARPGSAPPRCIWKCGKCEPCKAVHVPIQPGLITPLEYYPEAWRCKCGNKIFMP